MLTYVLPRFSASSCAAVRVNDPWPGDRQPRQSVLNAMPFTPRTPLLRLVTVGRPLRCANVSVQRSVLPVTLALKSPVARADTPFGWRTSCLAVSTAPNFVNPTPLVASRTAAEVAAVEPFGFVAVTFTRSAVPTSALPTPSVWPVAPAMLAQAPPPALQR